MTDQPGVLENAKAMYGMSDLCDLFHTISLLPLTLNNSGYRGGGGGDGGGAERKG